MNLIDYAKSFIGTRYQWGANGGGAFDCSGFVQEVLASQGYDPIGDQTALDLYRHFKNNDLGNGSGIHKNSLLFFGGSVDRITHVAMAIGNSLMIEAGGGGPRTETEDDAIRDNAMVRVRPILSRSDLVAAIKIKDNKIYHEN